MGNRECHICQTRAIEIGKVVCCDSCWAVAKVVYGKKARIMVYDDEHDKPVIIHRAKIMSDYDHNYSISVLGDLL